MKPVNDPDTVKSLVNSQGVLFLIIGSHRFVYLHLPQSLRREVLPLGNGRELPDRIYMVADGNHLFSLPESPLSAPGQRLRVIIRDKDISSGPQYTAPFGDGGFDIRDMRYRQGGKDYVATGIRQTRQ